MNHKALAIIASLLLLAVFPLSVSQAATVSTINVTFNQGYCTLLGNQQSSASVSASSGSCTIAGSISHSPFFLANSTTSLTIPSGFSLTLASQAFQFASYGNITNQGTITIASSGSLVLYGRIENSGTITITGSLAVINTTDSTSRTSFGNNAGHTVTVVGRIYNVGNITNAGTFTNSGSNFYDCVSGLGYLGTFTNTGTFNGGTIKTTC
jgi:hypothetical protein